VHAAALRLALDQPLRLAFRADEDHVLAGGRHLREEVARAHETLDRLADVDDVDQVALAEDERLHLRMPTADPVPEVDSCLDEALYLDE
jgi:hypothetical protein